MAGWSPGFTQREIDLFTACSFADPDQLERALLVQPRLDLLDADGMNPLHALAEARSVNGAVCDLAPNFKACAVLLLQAGFDPQSTGSLNFSRTPAQVAARSGMLPALQAFGSLGFSMEGSLWPAAKLGSNLDVLSFLIAAGCDPRAPGPDGLSALEQARGRWGGPQEGALEVLTAGAELFELRDLLPESQNKTAGMRL